MEKFRAPEPPSRGPVAPHRRARQGLGWVAQEREIFPSLSHPAEALARSPMWRNSGQITPSPCHAAAAHRGKAHDGEEKSRLASPVAPQHRQAPAVLNFERDAIEHDSIAVTGAQIIKCKEWLRHGVLRRDRLRAHACRRRSPAAPPRPEFDL